MNNKDNQPGTSWHSVCLPGSWDRGQLNFSFPFKQIINWILAVLGLLLLCFGFSSRITCALQLWCSGLTALLLHVESSRTRNRTCIPCTGRWVPNYGTTWEVPQFFFYYSISVCSWQIDGETMETVRDFVLGGSKITTDGDCSHEIKRRFLEEKLWPT